MEQLIGVAVGGSCASEYGTGIEKLIPDSGGEVFPLRIFGIDSGLLRIEGNVAEAAGHSDYIRAHQVGIVVVARIGIISVGVPSFASRAVELWIGIDSQTNNARRSSVHRGVDALLRTAYVEPQTELVCCRGLRHSRLIDQAQVFEPGRAAPGIDSLQQVCNTITALCHPVPEDLIARCPQ